MKTIAIIGCGKRGEGQQGWAIGHAHANGYQHCGEAVKLYGVDLSPDNLTAFGHKFDLPKEQLFGSTDALYAALTPDIVSICTWPGLHAPMAIEAMERGAKALIIEKPLALDVEQINQIQNKADETGTVVAVAHQRRYEPYFRALKTIIQSNKLGLPIRIEAQVGNDWDILSWTTHWFDMANFLFDQTPKYVLAGMDITNKRIYGHATENASTIFAEYSSNHTATFITGPQKHTNLRLIGPNGVTVEKESAVLVCTDKGVETVPYQDTGFEDAFAELCSQVIRASDGGPEPTCSIKQCSTATEIAYAAHESARTSRKVTLPLQSQFPPIEVLQHASTSELKGKRALLFADAHFGSGGREGIANTLEALTQIPPIIIDADTHGLSPEDVATVDFIAIYHTQRTIDPTTQSVLKNWVDQQRQLCIIHAGLGAYPEWEDYQKWCGLAWDWNSSHHPHDTSTLRTTKGNPLNFSSAEFWLPRDEVFVALKATSPVTIGLTATLSTGETFPAAWTPNNYPNISIWMPGHRQDSWSLPSMRSGLERTLLAATSSIPHR